MSTRRLVLSSLLAAVLGLSAGLFAASPAQATFYDCNAYEDVVCLWENGDYSGQIWRQRPHQIVGCRAFGPDSFNDEASRIYNKSARSVVVFEHSNCTGVKRVIAPFAEQYWGNTLYNDQFSGIRMDG